MKVIHVCTNHKDESEVEAILEYNGEDTWTFKLPEICFSISDLKDSMEFLEQANKD